MQVQVVIPSRQRRKVLEDNALRLFPDAVITVAESEMADYAGVVPPDRLIPHIDELTGIAPIRQWVLDQRWKKRKGRDVVGEPGLFPWDCIVFADDDVYRLVSMVGVNPTPINHPGDIRQVLENSACIAEAIGSPVFGYNQSWNVREFVPLNPLAFHRWVGGVIGFVGRKLRYDTSLRLRADIDLCLQALLKFRTTYSDGRFAFMHRRFGVTGGNAVNRSADRNKQELAYLQRKWGRYLEVKDVKSTTRLILHVERRQSGIKLANRQKV
jgi:hypothetical protein